MKSRKNLNIRLQTEYNFYKSHKIWLIEIQLFFTVRDFFKYMYEYMYHCLTIWAIG